MKIIIFGSRDITDYELLKRIMIESNAINKVTEIVSGGARGADRLGERWAEEHKIPIKRFIPDWKTLGRKAGILRNEDMGRYADGGVGLWNGSPGTKHMINFLKSLGKHVYVKDVRSK